MTRKFLRRSMKYQGGTHDGTPVAGTYAGRARAKREGERVQATRGAPRLDAAAGVPWRSRAAGAGRGTRVPERRPERHAPAGADLERARGDCGRPAARG